LEPLSCYGRRRSRWGRPEAVHQRPEGTQAWSVWAAGCLPDL